MFERRRRRPENPDRQYRREAARLRALADASRFTEVKRDLAEIAQDYDALARQREHNARRYGDS